MGRGGRSQHWAWPGRFPMLAHAADKKFKIFLSMSYIGNDWQAEAANMVKAMASHKDFADKVDLQVQVAGPNAQRQIQQINAMVQQGAQAIVVYPISPTALNAAVKNACDKGVMIIAYDADISEPCAYNVSIDQEEAGRCDRRVAGQAPQRQGQYRRHHGRAGNFGRYAAHEGREGSVRQASGHQDRGRSGRHVEPGGRAHRTVENSRDPHLGPDRRTVDAGRLLHREHDADRSRARSRIS